MSTRTIDFREPIGCEVDKKDGTIRCWTLANAWTDEAKYWLDTYNLPRTEQNILDIAEAMDEAGEAKAKEMSGNKGWG